MTLPDEALSETSSPPPRTRPRHRGGWSIRLSCGGALLLLLLDLALLALIGWPVLQARLALLTPTSLPTETVGSLLDHTATPTGVSSVTPTTEIATTPTATSQTSQVTYPTPAPLTLKNGVLFLSLYEGTNAHLFVYQPDVLPLTRLTGGPSDDINPSISPDGKQLAFASNRNGYWDLFLLEVASGEIIQLTDSFPYEAAPSWSPDGMWIAFESYTGNNLDINIIPVAGDQAPIPLTSELAADYSPAWSPKGRQIAYVSNRSGEDEIWIADLDKAGDDRYTNISRNPKAKESHPVWSPDGRYLAWASLEEGYQNIYQWDSTQPDLPYRLVGSGSWPTYDPGGKIILTLVNTPNQTYLTAYPLDTPGLALPPMSLPGAAAGLAWKDLSLPWPLPEKYRAAVALTPTQLWVSAVTPAAEIPSGRSRVVQLPKDIQAPQAMLLDAVDDSFLALRQSLANELGWDFLSSLKNAYVPLTSPLDPGMGDDWLYTGRAISINPLPISAGWMVIVREDYGSQTYWRVYLRSRFQDGSAGMPLHDLPWDFNARYTGDTTAYEAGGALLGTIPAGYWLDFTQFAEAYGWQRLPALLMWRSAYPLARFNEFVRTDGLDWRTAILQLYPPEVLITPTSIIPPTKTLTATPRWYQTATSTPTFTPRPTYTPVPPTPTITVTGTTTPTATPTPTRTATATKKPPTPTVTEEP